MNKILYCVSIAILFFVSSLALAKPAPSHAANVVVHNLCEKSINFHVDNNWGSMYTGNYQILANDKKPLGFIFSSNNDEEHYTVSYGGATCKIDYPKIAKYWTLDVYFNGCDRTPTCKVK